MKFKSILLTAAATISLATAIQLHAQVTRPVGINISYVADYSTELVFTNAFLQCRDWISCNANNTGPWDTQVSVPLRPDGYPLQLPYDDGVNLPQKLKTLMIWDLFSATPTGTFRLKSSGTGQIRLTHGATGTYNSPVDTLVQVTGGVILELVASDINDPVHDIKFILPGYINTYQTQTFTSEFLDFLSDFQVIRFMDFTNTNGSQVVSWSDRTLPDYYTQGKFGGVAWDYVVQLANITQKDIWINIPHKADNAFLDSLANFLQNGLESTFFQIHLMDLSFLTFRMVGQGSINYLMQLESFWKPTPEEPLACWILPKDSTLSELRTIPSGLLRSNFILQSLGNDIIPPTPSHYNSKIDKFLSTTYS